MDRFSSSLETTTSAPDVPVWQRWRERLQDILARGRGAVLFAAGVAAALVALLLYEVATPDPPQLTMSEVNDTVAQALASATPKPPRSAGAAFF